MRQAVASEKKGSDPGTHILSYYFIYGISKLTVAYVDDTIFKVSIIPHTKNVTTLLRKKLGDLINLECDMIGKYIEKMMLAREQTPVTGGINMNFLSEHGFV